MSCSDKIIFHVDVNSAFLSWEAVYRLEHLHATLDLRESPSAVGGSTIERHGIILAKSLPAKAYGIHTGETLSEARRKCPGLQIVPPHYRLYSRCSQAFIAVLKDYTPDVEQYSIDEAFLDMSGTGLLFGEPLQAAEGIKDRIREELGFTVNIGISSNKLLAKMASDFRKPDRVHTLFPEEIPVKMWPLPVSELFFAGRASFRKLHSLGIRTIGDLAHTDPGLLHAHLKSHGEVLYNYANGRDDSPVVSAPPANKGYGNSTTTCYDVCDVPTAELVLLSLAETLGMRLRKDGVQIRTVSLGIKYYDLSYASHQKQLASPTDITEEIWRAACELFSALWNGAPIRHLGIHTDKVCSRSGCRQLELWDFSGSSRRPSYGRLEKADRMEDLIRSRFGLDAVKRAAFARPASLPADHLAGGISRQKQTVDYSGIEIL